MTVCVAASPGIATLVSALREVIWANADAAATADLVAQQLRMHMPVPTLLTAEQRLGSPDRYTQHLLHVEPDGSFSIVALVWRPGQETPIHDHVAWCVVAVVEGTEYEIVYNLHEAGGQQWLVETLTSENPPGSVSAFAPPGDIHRVRNFGAKTAISIHVYGADISRLGSSIRRCYELPVRKRV